MRCAAFVLPIFHFLYPAAAVFGQRSSPAVGISPSVIMLRAKPGQSTTQTVTITNSMPYPMRFDLEAKDVVIKNQMRTYVRAGEIPAGIAVSATFSPAFLLVTQGGASSAKVTVTMPESTGQRAVVIYFNGRPSEVAQGAAAYGVAMGALITFNLSDDAKLVTGPITASKQTATENLNLSEEIENDGAEPAFASGVLAILDSRGQRVAKAIIGLTHQALDGMMRCPAHELRMEARDLLRETERRFESSEFHT